MIDTKKIRIALVNKDKTQKDLADAIGISSKTFYTKMKDGTFGLDELEKIAKYLNITIIVSPDGVSVEEIV